MGENDVECGCMMCLEDKVERQQSEISQLRCELHEAGKIIASLQEGLEKAWDCGARVIEEGNNARAGAKAWRWSARGWRSKYKLTERIRGHTAHSLGRECAKNARLREGLEEIGDRQFTEEYAAEYARAVLKGTENGE